MPKIPYYQIPFLYLSGTDLKTIAHCPSENATRYAILGSLVCVPAIAGLFSASFAFSLIFPGNVYAQITAGVVWAFTILTIDRSIAAHNPETGAAVKKGANNKYYARIALSFILGIIIAEPFCLQAFQDEINEDLGNQTRTQIEKGKKVIDSAILSHQHIIETSLNDWKALRDSADREATGHGGSHRRGRLTIYDARKADADTARNDYFRTRQFENTVIDSFQREKAKLIQEVTLNKARGLSGRISALHRVSNEGWAMWLSINAFRIFLIVLELIPLILKNTLKKPTDAYVVNCERDNQFSIQLNDDEATNVYRQKLNKELQTDDELLDKALAMKKIKNATRDFKFYHGLQQEMSEVFKKTKNKVTDTLDGEISSTQAIANIIKAYDDFLAEIQRIFTSKSKQDEQEE